VAALVAILLPLLMLMAAAAVDVSAAWATKRNLSVAADGAALAAAGRIGEVAPINPGNCEEVLTSTAISAAISAAQASEQGTAPGSSIVVGQPRCVDNGTAIEVQVSNSKEVQSFFLSALKLFGGNPQPLTPKQQATARIGPATTVTGLRPFAICLATAQNAMARPNQTFVADLNNKIGICGTTEPGNWGTVDFNGGAYGANDLADWTRNGYPGAITIDRQLPAGRMPRPGEIDGPLTSLLDQVVLLPVVTRYNHTRGVNNPSFDTVAFVGAKICGYSLNNKIGRGSCWDASKAAKYIDNKVDFLEFQYVNYSTSSYPGAGGSCAFGSSCDMGVTGVSLYK